jgi:glycosyltransferase involved in cell wall biosynthesis
MIKYSSKILTLSTSFSPPKGGIAQVVNVYSTLFNPFYHIATKKHDSTVGKVNDIVLAYFKTIYYFIFKDIEIVHIHGASYNSFWRKRLFINLTKLFHKKVVYHVHGGEYHLFYEQQTEIVKKTVLKCDLVIAISGYWKKFYEQEIGHKNVKIIENIVEPPQRIDVEKNNYCHFLYLGALNKGKGIYDLLEVINSNKEEFRNKIKIHIGGNGEVDKVRAFIKERNIEDIVIFEGWVSGEKKYQLLSQADVYILPSYNEGLPISILEAMSYKLPIISTAVGGIPEVVEHLENGLLVEAGNLEEIKEAMLIMSTDQKLREKAVLKSLEKIHPHLPKQVEKKLESIYQDLLDH